MSGRVASAVRPTYRFTVALLPSRDEIPVLLNRRELLGRGVEVGVQRGLYSEAILESWRGFELVSIDPWLADAADRYVDDSNVPQQDQERNFAETKNRLRRFGDRSTIWRMTSVEAAAALKDGSLDFVYLDARHDFDSVTEDLAAWFPKLRSGGVLAGHDYYDGVYSHGVYGVRSAVNSFAARNGLKVFSTYQDRWPSWLAVVGTVTRRQRVLRPVELSARAAILISRSAMGQGSTGEDKQAST